jgi:hypothetical protein
MAFLLLYEGYICIRSFPFSRPPPARYVKVADCWESGACQSCTKSPPVRRRPAVGTTEMSMCSSDPLLPSRPRPCPPHKRLNFLIWSMNCFDILSVNVLLPGGLPDLFNLGALMHLFFHPSFFCHCIQVGDIGIRWLIIRPLLLPISRAWFFW